MSQNPPMTPPWSRASSVSLPVSKSTLFRPTLNSERAGYCCMLGASAGFALMGVCVKLATASLPVSEVAFFRCFGGALLAAVAMALWRVPFRPQQPALLAWRGALGWLSMTSYYVAVAWLPLSTAVLLNYTSPLLTALFAALMLGERLTARTLIALFTASLGVAVVLAPQGLRIGAGAAVAIASACFAALAFIALKRATGTNPPTTIVLVSMLISAVLSIPGMIGHYVPPTSTTWWLLLATTICGLVTQLLMTHGYRLARASTASAMTLITPLFAAVASLALLGEALPAGTWLGGTLILGAGILHFTGATLPAIK